MVAVEYGICYVRAGDQSDAAQLDARGGSRAAPAGVEGRDAMLILLNSRNREVFRGTEEPGGQGRYRYTGDGCGGAGLTLEEMYRAAAVVAVDIASARPAGPLAGLWRQWLARTPGWPMDEVRYRGK